MIIYFSHHLVLKFNWLCLIQLTLVIIAALLHIKTEASKLVVVSNNNETDVNATTTKRARYWPRRSTPPELSTTKDTYQCDYVTAYCLRAYNTSILCGRTAFWEYHDFTNYCMLDYVNCMERYEMWQVAYMGHCFYMWPKEWKTYQRVQMIKDKFLDQFYLEDDWNLEHMFVNT